MSIVDQLKHLYCVSEFEDRPLNDAALFAIVAAASWGPSAADAQPWEIIALRGRERKLVFASTLLDSLLRPNVEVHERQDWILQAPVILIVCLDLTRAKARFGAIGAQLFGIQDTGAAIQNMRLVALEHGVKSCMIREFDRYKLAKLLELPDHVRPLIAIVCGYSHMDRKRKPGLPLEDYLHLEQW